MGDSLEGVTAVALSYCIGVVLAVLFLLAGSWGIRTVRRWRWLRSERTHFTCHRVGDTCAWDGCPNQRDDRACDGCYLAPKEN